MAAPKNLGDVYYEREHTEWYWRALGTVSASLILLGFLVFPKAFASPDKDPQTLVPLSIVAVVLLALGYSLSVALWFTCRSWLFQFDVLFTPCLCSCVLGAINIGINIAVPSSSIGMSWSTAPISALALALVSTMIYAILCAVTYAKIRRARRQGVTCDEGDDTTKPETDAEDTQRKAWAQLLSPMASFNNQSRNDSSTYRIDIPDKVRLGTKGDPDVPRSNSSWSLGEYSLEGATMNGPTDTERPKSPPPNPYMLNPNAAALQEARARALQRSRRDLSTRDSTPRELASSEAQTPSTPVKDAVPPYPGSVYGPASESVYSTGYGAFTIADYAQSESSEDHPRPEELDTRMVPPQHWV